MPDWSCNVGEDVLCIALSPSDASDASRSENDDGLSIDARSSANRGVRRQQRRESQDPEGQGAGEGDASQHEPLLLVGGATTLFFLSLAGEVRESKRIEAPICCVHPLRRVGKRIDILLACADGILRVLQVSPLSPGNSVCRVVCMHVCVV